MQKVSLNSFRFDLHGLQLDYDVDGEKSILIFDPCATCDLLKYNKLIEDFDIDKNGEPVILFTDRTYPEGYGFDQWISFVVFFPIKFRTAQLLLESWKDKQQFEKDEATIGELLSPLEAA